MSKIKEKDILKLLRGKASPKKLKALEEWSSMNSKNAISLEKYQRIYDEADHLASYQRVDSDQAWKQFSKSLQTSVSDQEILSYFDGLASPGERKKVDDWKNSSRSNEAEFETFNIVLNESGRLSDYKKVDVGNEWLAFSAAIKSKDVEPVIEVSRPPLELHETIKLQPVQSSPAVAASASTMTAQAKEIPFVATQKEERSNRVFMWRALAIAASILLLAAFSWSLWQSNSSSNLDNNQFLTYATGEYPEVITISDGTIISLDRRTTLTYFKDVNLVEERTITIDGKGEFDVASNPKKPFIVRTKQTGVGIRVLGTKFRFEKSDKFQEVIENIEGSVRAYSLSDTATYVLMSSGDKYGFDGVQFIDIRDREEDYNGKEYDLLYVLDFLMENSGWKVTSAPYSEFDPESVITVDLSKPYEEILEDLARREDFEYVKMPCEGCYLVTRFKAP